MADGNARNETVVCLEQSISHIEDHLAYMVKKARSLRARYVYGFIFLSTNLLAWFVRDYGYKVLAMFQPTRVHGDQGEDLFHVGGVLRMSLGLFLSTLFYTASFGGLTLMYFIYVPDSTGVLNISLIAWTAILVLMMMTISLHSKVNTGLLSSGMMGLYIVFLCWSSIQSEPFTSKRNSHVDWLTILSFLIAICSIVMSTFTMGSDFQSFQYKDEVQTAEDTPYKYEFFHFIFSVGAMHFAMLFISWDLKNHPTAKWSIDVGWASTWVKFANELFAVFLYLCKLTRPIAMRNRRLSGGQEEHMQPGDCSV